MKKTFAIALITTLSINLFAQSTDESKLRLGLGTSYVSEIESISLSIKGIYEITEKWEAAIALSHVFENIGISWEIIDLDGHFVFYNNGEKFSAYALAGVALNFWRREMLLVDETKTGSYIGMNVGAGVNIAVSKHFNIAPELRGTLFDLSYTRIGITVQYMF